MTTEFDKMIKGELYRANDEVLTQKRLRARRLTRLFNETPETEIKKRDAILRELFGRYGDRVIIEPDFRCDYGGNISLGDDVYMNFNCVILDCAQVYIGNNVMFGPNVQVYTATHPLEAELRCSGSELAKPITIGNRVWIGGSAVICPGVTIGEDTTIGAGSVVTKDIPARVFAAGNPCRVIRDLSGDNA